MSSGGEVLGGSQRSLQRGLSSHGAGSGRMMHHSHSTPAGVDSAGTMTSSLGRNCGGGGGGGTGMTPRVKGGKMLAVRVLMLDETSTIFQIQSKALGRVLFEQVCRQLNLLEEDYFGLEYEEHNGTKYWLDLEKPICRQVGFSLADPFLRFCVKFYTPDPGQLEEEFTRYLFCLQIKRDLSNGTLTCNAHTAALLSSYIVQSECGDYVAEDYPNHTYLSHYKFTPRQDDALERRIMENHKKHMGQSPAQADMNLLETARRCESYGMKMHPAKDHENVPLNLAVAHMGIVVFQNITKINTFSWAKIRKLSFKRKRFLIKLHHDAYGYYKDIMEFFFEGRNECKNFWKKCVENHGFFRCTAVKRVPRHKTRVLSRGSSFRYSGKTQRQMVEYVRDNYVKRQTFQRSQSFRHSSAALGGNSISASSGHSVNASISAHPLLPLADPVELTSQLPSWSSMSPVSRTTTPMAISSVVEGEAADVEGAVSPRRSTRTASNNSIISNNQQQYQHHHAAAVLRVETHAPPATSPSYNNNVMTNASVSSPVSTEEQQRRTPRSTSPPSAETARAIHAAAHRRRQQQHQPYTGGISADNSIQSENNNSYIVSESPGNAVERSRSNGYNNGNNDSGKENVYHQSNMSGKQQLHADNDKNSIKSKSNGSLTRDISGSITNEMENKKKKWPTGKSYYIAKEILMTERTYKKDLDVITMWFRERRTECADPSSPQNEDGSEVDPHLSALSALSEALTAHHAILLQDAEQRLAAWEGRAQQNQASSHQHHRIGDVLLKHLIVLQPLYEDYLESHHSALQRLEESFWSDALFQQAYRDFEHRKACYLPLTTFLLKPLQRVLHYELLVDRLLQIYPAAHLDRENCERMRSVLAQTVKQIRNILPVSENYAQLCELQRDILGFDKLVQEDRCLIRIGCLLKHSTRGGLQQRMFFLFSDIMLYASKHTLPQTFKVHGHVPLRALLLKDGDSPNSFVIFGGTRSITVSANNEQEKSKWVSDIADAVQNAKEHGDSKANYLSLKSCSSSEEIMDSCGLDVIIPNAPSQRSNTALHVCWHRAATITLKEQLLQAENQLSGYLLRKFKNSSGWQKLWVVFTSFCLYFYKTYQDEAPLASLPLLGYTISPPSEQDAINKEFVFKLTFKNHVYFFRAESEHTFSRWMEVIGSATNSPKVI